MPYSANVIALALVQKGIETGKFVTQMKLQKMVFFAHGYNWARFGEPLIFEQFMAWKFGPVVPTIYQGFKFYGSRPITSIDFRMFSNEIEVLNRLFTDPKAAESIEYTWAVTENLSAEALSNWTHQPNSPWYKVYKPGISNIAISDHLIEEYFKVLVTKTNGASARAATTTPN